MQEIDQDSFTPNVASRLRVVAASQPSAVAIATPVGRYRPGYERAYQTQSFADLELQTSSIAAGLQQMGIKPGQRIVMLVKFGPDFISVVFALLKVGAVVVLIDPGMGRGNLIKCLEESNPDGFIAIPAAQAILKAFLKRRFPNAVHYVTAGKRYGVLPKPTLRQLAGTPSAMYEEPDIKLESPAAIIFTTGSTGPPKGVLYTHQTFNNQVDQLVKRFDIRPGGTDLSAFPLFGLFNAVMGTTTVIPDMDPTKPADVDPPRLLDAIDQWQINQAFGSPALWTKVGKYAAEKGRKLSSLKLVLSAGAPVAPQVLEWMREIMPDEGQMYTPYGATEALPLASIESRTVLEETASLCNAGAGTCVGERFDGIDWKVIKITDDPLHELDQVEEVPNGEIGELMVRGKVVTTKYVTRTDQNALHKVHAGEDIWHRMGDVGYLDQQGRFWCCGRKSQRVQTKDGVLFTEPCEAIINTHDAVYRSALVGLGAKGSQTPVAIIETWPERRPRDSASKQQLSDEIAQLVAKHDITRLISHVLVYPNRLPTDIRHNSKIFREKLVPWAEKQLRGNV